jgi:hypothetical protein
MEISLSAQNSASKRWIWQLALAIVAVSLLIVMSFTGNLLVHAQTEGVFTITPSNINVSLSKLQPVRTTVNLSNGLSQDLDFEVKLDESVIKDLEENGVAVSLVDGGTTYNLNHPILPAEQINRQNVLTLKASSTKNYEVVITPSKEKNYQVIIPIAFHQTSENTGLTVDDHTIEVQINSKMAANKQDREQQLLLAGGVGAISLVAIAILTALYYWQKPKKLSEELVTEPDTLS